MLISMKRSVFDSLDYAALGWACIEPTILQIRGKDSTVKYQVYEQLSPGQRALLMFYVLYGHSHSVAEFSWYASYLMFELKAWSEIKSGIRYFGDEAMFLIYEEMEGVIIASNRLIEAKSCKVSVMDLDDDSEILENVGRLYELFRKIVPETIKRISTYIRNNPDEFVRLED